MLAITNQGNTSDESRAYDYRNASGTVVYRVIRQPGKKFYVCLLYTSPSPRD